jgi:RNA polymerase sigma-70 factor (ECF subfamily)
MGSDASTISAFEDAQWLRRFAQRLTRDADEADDLVQETLVEAWRDPPADTRRSLRPWLASVLRNRRRMSARSQQRRQRRERLAHEEPSGPVTPDAEHQRLEVLSILVTALQELGPEDQRILVRRFFDGDSAAEIARALGVPSATIRSRIHRGLERLRQHLDRAYGERKTWCAAVLAMDGPAPATTVAPAASSPTMSLTAKLLALPVIAALGATVVLAVDAPTMPDAPPVAAPDVEPASAEPAEVSTPRAVWERRRRQIDGALASAPRAPEAAAASSRPDPEASHRAYRQLVQACIEDLDSEAVGALTLSIREIGAPDIGTIFDSVEVAHTNFDDEETLECLVQSMYAYVGEAPPEPFERNVTRTMRLGDAETEDAQSKQVVGYIVGAHAGEVRFCGTKADEVAGSVTYTVTIADNGSVASSVAGETDLPSIVVECITAATLRWKFPATVAGRTLEHTLTLPIPGQPPGPAKP